MNLALHSTALAAFQQGFPVLAGPTVDTRTGQPYGQPVLTASQPVPIPQFGASRLGKIGKIDPVSKTWNGLDVTQKSMLAAHGAILLAVAYHGYARNRGAVGWALAWALGGFLCPTVTFGYAMTQGFAKPLPKGD